MMLKLRFFRAAYGFGLAPALAATTAQAHRDPHLCGPDVKLIGAFLVSTVDAPDTWWGLTHKGMVESGIPDNEDALKETMQRWFGIGFNSLSEAVTYLVAQVAPYDANGNGYVCAYSKRGTRAYLGDPNYTYYLFGVSDDRPSTP